MTLKVEFTVDFVKPERMEPGWSQENWDGALTEISEGRRGHCSPGEVVGTC